MFNDEVTPVDVENVMLFSQIPFCYVYSFRFLRFNVSFFAHAYWQVAFSSFCFLLLILV